MSSVKTIEPNIYKVNGRTHYFARIEGLRKVSASKFDAEMSGGRVYRIEGGKAAGGSSTDWFIDGPGFIGSLHCVGLVDALKTLNGM